MRAGKKWTTRPDLGTRPVPPFVAVAQAGSGWLAHRKSSHPPPISLSSAPPAHSVVPQMTYSPSPLAKVKGVAGLIAAAIKTTTGAKAE